ncbi:YciI family protein [Neobacillus cucumis]|uniref:YciI family protein n=1 Tax=Neobacillus cucumis TaxID=1740721 RepID=UPI00204222FF|nr:YciI family protein [Neobacillus cucumis]MCM3726653.1 YciI family protein [Neobacillus cucumis]
MKKYLVLIERKPSFTGDFIQGHREFLQNLREVQTLITAGGFEDQTGGAYVLQANSLEEARMVVKNDPMNHENESVYKVKEWNAV